MPAVQIGEYYTEMAEKLGRKRCLKVALDLRTSADKECNRKESWMEGPSSQPMLMLVAHKQEKVQEVEQRLLIAEPVDSSKSAVKSAAVAVVWSRIREGRLPKMGVMFRWSVDTKVEKVPSDVASTASTANNCWS